MIRAAACWPATCVWRAHTLTSKLEIGGQLLTVWRAKNDPFIRVRTSCQTAFGTGSHDWALLVTNVN